MEKALEETKKVLQNNCIPNCGHNANESCICKIAICFKEIENAEKEIAEYKALLEEYEHYKIFTELFFDVFKAEYDGNKYTLTLTPYEQYDIENIDFKICLIKEDADKILKAIEVLASEETDE